MTPVSSSTEQPFYYFRNQRKEKTFPTEKKGQKLNLSTINNVSAIIAEFVSKVLLEKELFQNANIPQQVLLDLANDLVQTLSNANEECLNLSRELTILYKELIGKPLTKEEKAYDESVHQLNVTAEIMSGIRYSATAFIGQSFYSSINSIIQQRLWAHIPSVCAYFGASFCGSQGVKLAVIYTLEKTDLSTEQKEKIAPWLNMLGRIALGCTPKVHATDDGVHYHYPSSQGHTTLVSENLSLTRNGNTFTLKQQGTLETLQGTYNGEYSAQFNLHRIHEINKEKFVIQVTKDIGGNPIPVTFIKTQGTYGPEITVQTPDKELRDLWSKYFTFKKAPEESSLVTPNLPCISSLLVAASQQPALMAITALSCGSGVQAQRATPKNPNIALPTCYETLNHESSGELLHFEPYLEGFIHPGFYTMHQEGQENDISCRIKRTLIEAERCKQAALTTLEDPAFKEALQKELQTKAYIDGYFLETELNIGVVYGVSPRLYLNYKNALRIVEIHFLTSPFEELRKMNIEEKIKDFHSALMDGLKTVNGRSIAQGEYRTRPIVVQPDDLAEDIEGLKALVEKKNGKNSFKTLLSARQKFFKDDSLERLTSKEKDVFRSVYYACPPTKDVPRLMQKFAEDYIKRVEKSKSKKEVFELAAWIHMTLVNIHPFEDGNGRIARILMNTELKRRGYHSIVFLNEIEYIKAIQEDHTNPSTFYQYLLQAYNIMPLEGFQKK